MGALQTPSGLPVGAVYGFAQLLERLISEAPTHLAVAFDSAEKPFRKARYEDYKIHRPPMPEELAAQFPLIKELLAAYRIPFLEFPGYEADDLIATLSKRASREGIPTFIVSKDKDLEQLLDPFIQIYNPRDGGCLDVNGLLKKKGLRPDQVIDFLALVGDTTDNVPGIQGIGPKTALKILSAVDRLDNAFDADIPGLTPRIQEKLRSGRKVAELSRELVTLVQDCPIPGIQDLGFYALQSPDRKALLALFRRFQFLRLLDRYSREEGDHGCQPEDQGSPRSGTASRTDSGAPLPSRYTLVRNREELEELALRLRSSGTFALDTETGGLDPFQDPLVGLSFAIFRENLPRTGIGEETNSTDQAGSPARTAGVDAFYIPLRAPESLEMSPGETMELLRSVLEDGEIGKVGQNIKFDVLFLRRAGVNPRGIHFDTMIASYLLNPEVRAHNIDSLALEYLDHRKIPTEDLIGSGRGQISMEQVPLEKIRDYACEDADVALRLWRVLVTSLEEAGLGDLMRDVEMPLVEVLVEMELAGIAIDPGHLKAMGSQIHTTLEKLTVEIHSLAEGEFNIASPHQLAEVLYKQLGLPPGPRGKSGVPSTAGEILLEIQDRHPVVPKILEFRELTKLLNTYVEALPNLVKPCTGRIHTSFNQTVAATGRLSSSEPNLQNIPIKTDLGREIRRAFTSGDPNRVLLSADYSQVELRILAHLSDDPALVEAFRRNEDIHRVVASQIHGVPPEKVTPSMRRFAKSINFGIVYGMTPFGLARDLGISKEEASVIIRSYFERHPGVRAFVDETISRAREEGSVRTILGRRRPIRDIRSRNYRLRTFSERTAVNSVVQGSAADLIKVAMNNIHTDLQERGSSARLLLQIHDELVLEVPREELSLEEDRVRSEMVHAMELKVPLVVNTIAGSTWFEAKD